MSRWTGRMMVGVLVASLRICADPAMTTIQDTLYTADGNRFNGVVTITWQSFEAGDTSNISAQSRRLSVTNGNLYVQLVPTTTSATPATYAVQYNTSSNIQFTEIWAVPPSSSPLRVRDVRLSPGAVSTTGAASQNASVQIADVVGLQSALNLRPTIGTGFASSRAAVINAMGAVDGAVGAMSDCLHVDGTSGPCGSGSGGSGSTAFVDAEVPAGALDGVNATFTLANAPNPSASLALFRNGLLLKQGVDYTVSNSTIAFQAGAVPRSADMLLAYYRLTSLPGVGFVDAETPAGSVDGVNSSFSLSQAPNPASSLAVYRNGIRLKLAVDYNLNGNGITFVSAMVPQTGDVLLCAYRIAQ